jgi:hypothetical protein
MKECLATEDTAPSFDQDRQQLEFGRCQVKSFPLQADFKIAFIEAKLVHVNNRRGLDRPHSSEQILDPENQFPGAERLRNIIVDAELQAGDAFRGGGFGCEHEDGYPRSFIIPLERFEDLGSAQLREHKVKHDRARATLLRGSQPGRSRERRYHIEPCPMKVVSDKIDNIHFVIYYQDNIPHPMRKLSDGSTGIKPRGKKMIRAAHAKE